MSINSRHDFLINKQNTKTTTDSNSPSIASRVLLVSPSPTMTLRLGHLALKVLVLQLILVQLLAIGQVSAKPAILMRVCDAREVKTITSRVCMLYKRTLNSDVKRDKQGNLRLSKRQAKGDYSPAKLASECCKVGCAPHIFANIC